MRPLAPTAIVMVIASSWMTAGCRQNVEVPTSPPAAPITQAPAPAAASPTAATTVTPAERLDEMDSRRPVALLPMMANHQKQNMRAHLEAVQQIVAGLAERDFAAVEKAAGAIGFSEQMGQMCNHMGAATPDFTPRALAFHHTADTIAEAARKKDSAGVLRALHATLAACTECHATYKQRVVDEASWSALAGAAPPTMHGH